MPALQEQLTQGLPLNAGNSIHGLAGTAAAITYTLFGAEVGPDHQVLNKVLAQGVLGTADGLVYAAPPHMNSAVTHLFLTNTTGSAVTGVAIGINGPASTAGNQLLPSLTIPANGSASFIDGVVRVNDASGNILQTAATPFGLTGLASIAAATAGIQNVETQVVGVTLPANFAAAGTTLAVEAYGTITSTVDNIVTFRVRVGATTLTGNIPASLAVHCGNSGTVTTAGFMLRVLVTVRTTGATGTVYGFGTVISLDSGAAVSQALALATELFTPASVAVDTTVSEIAELTCVTAAVTTTVTFQGAAISVVKQ